MNVPDGSDRVQTCESSATTSLTAAAAGRVLGDVIEAQRPDVVGLVEAEDPAVVETLAGRLGMDFVHAPGNSHASALLSRWTIRDSINHALLQPGSPSRCWKRR